MGTKSTKMSGGLDVLKPQEADITKMLSATTHIGSENSETTMSQYIFKRRTDGVNHQFEKNVGKVDALSASHRCRRKPRRCLCGIFSGIRSACMPEICKIHRSNCYCWTFYARCVHKSDPSSVP